MFALFMFVLAIALAPIILGVIGTMFGLIFTFILWAIAGFPDNTPKDTRPTAAQVAPASSEDAGDDPMEQLMEWERQDNARRRAYRTEQRRKDRTRLLEAQRRTHAAEDEVDHAEP